MLRTCNKCKLEKDITAFYKAPSCKDGVNTICKKCCQEAKLKRNKEYYYERRKLSRNANYVKNIKQTLYYGAKKRAKEKCLPFNIDLEDIVIPEKCPVLDILLECSNTYLRDNSPTMDRIIPALGYIKGNVEIISWRANRLKNDGNVYELEKIYLWLKSKTLPD